MILEILHYKSGGRGGGGGIALILLNEILVISVLPSSAPGLTRGNEFIDEGNTSIQHTGPEQHETSKYVNINSQKTRKTNRERLSFRWVFVD